MNSFSIASFCLSPWRLHNGYRNNVAFHLCPFYPIYATQYLLLSTTAGGHLEICLHKSPPLCIWLPTAHRADWLYAKCTCSYQKNASRTNRPAFFHCGGRQCCQPKYNICNRLLIAHQHCGRAFGNLLAQKPTLVHSATNCTLCRSALRQMYLPCASLGTSPVSTTKVSGYAIGFRLA